MGKGRGFGEDVLSFGYDWVYYWFFGVEAFEAFLIPNLGIYLSWDDDILARYLTFPVQHHFTISPNC